MNQTLIDNYRAAQVLYSQLLVSVNAVIANPTQENIAAAVAAINAGTWPGLPQAKIDYSLDGESYSWGAWHAQITKALADLNQLIQAASLPWLVTSRASVRGGVGGPRAPAGPGAPVQGGWSGTVGG